MSEARLTYMCGTCPHFERRAGLLAAPGMKYDGLCYGNAPSVMLVALPLPPSSIQQIGKEGAVITAQSQRPPVGENDRGCHLHPEAVWAADQDKWGRLRQQERNALENLKLPGE